MVSAGVYTVAPTPFGPKGDVDLDSVAMMARALVGLGVEGLLVLGVMGEADKLLDAERDAVLERFVSAVDGRAKIVAGTTHQGAIPTAELTRRAEELGADAVMVSPPRLAKPNPEAVFEYFEVVASRSSIEIVVQDHPASSGVFMPVELITRLASEIDQVSAVKLEDPPTPVKMASVLESNAAGLAVFGGLGGLKLIEELDAGASGTMTGFAYPEILHRIWTQHAARLTADARELFFQILPLILFEAQPLLSLAVRKTLYERRGFIADDYVRAPAARPNKATIDELDRLLIELDLE